MNWFLYDRGLRNERVKFDVSSIIAEMEPNISALGIFAYIGQFYGARTFYKILWCF